MRYKALYSALVIACISLMFGSSVHAGHSIADSVNVIRSPDGSSVHASGSLMDAVNGAGNLQYIGCEVSAYDTSSSVFCRARNADGITVYCTSSNARMFDAVAGANRFSFISFNGSNGVCTGVTVRYQSSYGL